MSESYDALKAQKDAIIAKEERTRFALQQNPILSRIVARLSAQTAKGIAKYGESVNPSNLSLLEWMEHEQQEAIDQMVYMEVVAVKVREAIEEIEMAKDEIADNLKTTPIATLEGVIKLLKGI